MVAVHGRAASTVSSFHSSIFHGEENFVATPLSIRETSATPGMREPRTSLPEPFRINSTVSLLRAKAGNWNSGRFDHVFGTAATSSGITDAISTTGGGMASCGPWIRPRLVARLLRLRLLGTVLRQPVPRIRLL